MQDLTGHVAWTTGAGAGIGRAMALAFAEAGCRLALAGRPRDTLAGTHRLVEAAGGQAVRPAAGC